MSIVIECPSIDSSSQGLLIRMPGGAELSVMTADVTPSRIRVAKNLLTQANGALAPLTPVFNIIDAVLSLKDCVEAIPKAITSLSPTPITDCIEDLVKKTAKLANLIPQLSTPIMIIDAINALISSLRGVIDQLEAILIQEIKIAAAALKANEPGNEALEPIIECGRDLVAVQKSGISDGLGPLNALIGVLNVFLELIGFDPLPNLADLPADTQESIDELDAAVKVLEDFRDTIPIP